MTNINKLSSKSQHNEILKSIRLKKLKENIKINMKKRKKITKKNKDG